MARPKNIRKLHYLGAGRNGRLYEAVCGRAPDASGGQLTPDVRYVECAHCLAYLRNVGK